jgi:predicted anti-sigma-YlaC factor YlaD
MSEAYTNATQRIGPEREPESDLNDCALVQDLLPLYLDHEVSPESHARIANHIAQCERCANYLAGARSMRVQLLRDQQAVRATAPVDAGAVVAHAQPMPNRTPNTLLPKLGRLLLGGAAVIGALILVPVLMPVALVAAIPVGMFIVGRSIWQSVRGRSIGAPSFPKGSAGAMLTALASVVGVLVCAGLIFTGLVILTETNEPAEQLVSVFMLIFGASGVMIINQRRGWLPQYASPAAVQQFLQFILLGGGVLAAAIIGLNLLVNVPLLFIGLVLAWVFWPRIRSRKP